ncbi:unnamed protein product [Acanthosepion pharaonis]|uniref:Uncharacterized protein n=1 Tax=Acanthosepion pharaonis TaxID=158019 RepID=A0A812CNF9_ACAPH|nr:unnamed protein product [Sepia pharaonis]
MSASNRVSSFATLGWFLLGLSLGRVGTGLLILIVSPFPLSAPFSLDNSFLNVQPFHIANTFAIYSWLKNFQLHRTSSTSEGLFLLGPPCLLFLYGGHNVVSRTLILLLAPSQSLSTRILAVSFGQLSSKRGIQSGCLSSQLKTSSKKKAPPSTPSDPSHSSQHLLVERTYLPLHPHPHFFPSLNPSHPTLRNSLRALSLSLSLPFASSFLFLPFLPLSLSLSLPSAAF